MGRLIWNSGSGLCGRPFGLLPYGLVAALTGGIYTPMTITVSCAGARAESGTQLKVGTDDPSRVMNKAVELARSSEAPVLVKF